MHQKRASGDNLPPFLMRIHVLHLYFAKRLYSIQLLTYVHVTLKVGASSDHLAPFLNRFCPDCNYHTSVVLMRIAEEMAGVRGCLTIHTFSGSPKNTSRRGQS